MQATAVYVMLVAASMQPGSAIREELYEGSKCRTSSGGQGVCTQLTQADCPWAQKELSANRRPVICSFSGLRAIVCCPVEAAATETPAVETFAGEANPPPVQVQPSPPNEIGRIAQEKCKEYAKYVFGEEESVALMQTTDSVDHCVTSTADPLIVGGTKAKPKEFPHMALIGFNSDNDDPIEYKCGGSLISLNFVLTAGHCLFAGLQPAQWVLLGELDRSITTEDAKPEVIEVAERFKHPDYNPPAVYNDIALLRLAEDATINGYVRPACLHTQPALRPRTSANGPHDEDVPVASGWGNTAWAGDPSEHLMRVALRVADGAQCTTVYRPDKLKVTRGIQFDMQLCAGGTDKDTCQGDSGGPLQVLSRNASSEPYCMYKIVGVTSFGNACGLAPGVYSRVYHYVSWIEKVVWPSPAAPPATNTTVS